MVKFYQLIMLITLIISQVYGAKYFETKRCLIECKHNSNITHYCQNLNHLAFKLCLMNKRNLPKNCIKICNK